MSQKKCFSQVMNIKMDEKINSGERKGSFFELSGAKNLIKGSILMLKFG